MDKLLAFTADAARFLLAIAICVVNAAIMYWLLTRSMPETPMELKILLANLSGSAQAVVLQYYFGSSASSAAKDRALAQKP